MSERNELCCWVFVFTQFVPFKKQYYQYVKREKQTVLEISSILESSSILDPALSQHSIRKLVV